MVLVVVVMVVKWVVVVVGVVLGVRGRVSGRDSGSGIVGGRGTHEDGCVHIDDFIQVLRRNDNVWGKHSIITRSGKAASIRGSVVALSDEDGLSVYGYDKEDDSYKQSQDSILNKYLDGSPISSQGYGTYGRTLSITDGGEIIVANSSGSRAILCYRWQEVDKKYVLAQKSLGMIY